MIKNREFEKSNYRAVWFNGKTIRVAIDPALPITDLEYPEFYDIKLTGHCEGGCPWCYMDSKKTDVHYEHPVEKINNYFGKMTENQRPFQVAIGGGEPTSHPEFVSVLAAFYYLGIKPNYTTNGMFVFDPRAEQIVEASKKYCGGVAVSCHPHLLKYWLVAADLFLENKIKLNFHLIISDKKSIDDFVEIYQGWCNSVDYFVLLPYGIQGRAEPKAIEWEYLLEKLPAKKDKLAFGANFYPYLKKGGHDIPVSLYEPEIFSKFLDLKDMRVYPSSFRTENEI